MPKALEPMPAFDLAILQHACATPWNTHHPIHCFERRGRDSAMRDAEDSSGSSSSSESESELPAPPPSISDVLGEEWARGLLDVHEPSARVVRVETRAGPTGALSRVRATTVHYATRDGEERALHVVVKTPPRDAFARLFVAEAQFDTREIMFYTQVVPALEALEKELLGGEARRLPVPRCVRAILPDEIGGDSELVLEDATALGYRPADFHEGLTARQAEAALKAIARVHALSFALRERDGPLDRRFDFLFPCDRAAAGYLRLARRGLPRLEAFLRARSDCFQESAAVADLAKRAPALLAALPRPPEPAPLAHSDFWCGNLLFRDAEDGECECLALDWQMASAGRATDDVHLLLLSSLEVSLRRAEGERLTRVYASALVERCEKLGCASVGASALLALESERARSELRALLLCAGGVDVALGEPRAERRLVEAVRDLHATGVLALAHDPVITKSIITPDS